MIQLDKSSCMTLQKGYSIRLERNGQRFDRISLGLSWGCLFEDTLSPGDNRFSDLLPLDGAVTSFAKGRAYETIYFRKLRSRDGSINHTQDDIGNNTVDHEVITIDLPMVNPAVDTIYVHLNSFRGLDFSIIPYSQLRLYRGGPTTFGKTLAYVHIPSENKLRGYMSMVLGKLQRHDREWSFSTVAQPVPAYDIPTTARYLEKKVHGRRSQL